MRMLNMLWLLFIVHRTFMRACLAQRMHKKLLAGAQP